jgi:uncharacterized protein (TIGR03435 family)
MKKAVSLILVMIVATTHSAVTGQGTADADQKATFEVASVKPSNPDEQGKILTARTRQLVTGNTTLLDLITFAYQLHVQQVVGEPSWASKDKYDVIGKPGAGSPVDRTAMRTMLQTLLADRFRLTFHRDKKDLSAYALVKAAKPVLLTKSVGNPESGAVIEFRGLGSIVFGNATFDDFCALMQQAVLDRPIVDKTGITGRYDFTLTWTPDETQFSTLGIRVPPPPADGSGPGLFTAVQEQLGLKLEPSRGPVDVVVIDHVEVPTPD